MPSEVEATGSTVDEAIDNALDELDASEDEVEIIILSDGEGTDPLHRSEARVRVRFRDERDAADLAAAGESPAGSQTEASRRAPVAPEVADAQADAVQHFLEGLIEVLGLDANVEAFPTDFGAGAEIEGEDLALLIGRHGATLAGVQELCRAVAQKATGERATVQVDIEGYMERRAETLERMARSAASKARKSGREIALEPMNARDRKLVHDALTDFRGVRTESEGTEPDRYVVIVPE